jgi:hypothetical protein
MGPQNCWWTNVSLKCFLHRSALSASDHEMESRKSEQRSCADDSKCEWQGKECTLSKASTPLKTPLQVKRIPTPITDRLLTCAGTGEEFSISRDVDQRGLVRLESRLLVPVLEGRLYFVAADPPRHSSGFHYFTKVSDIAIIRMYKEYYIDISCI